ncbi:uncharacterized protein DEA37_0012500, partial [Paragonimus westermani]
MYNSLLLLFCFTVTISVINAELFVNDRDSVVSAEHNLLVCSRQPCSMKFHATTGCMLVSATEPNIRVPLKKLTNLRFVPNLIPGPYWITCGEGQKLILIVRDSSLHLDCSAVPALIDQNLSYPNSRLCVYRPKLRTEWMKFAGSIVEQATEFPKCMIGRFPANTGSLLTLSLIQRLPFGKSNITCGQQHSQTIRVIHPPRREVEIRERTPGAVYKLSRLDSDFSVCVVWTSTPTETGCSFDELSISADCSYSVNEVVGSHVDVTCSIPDHNVPRRFTVEVLIDRPVLLVCNDMNIIVEPNNYRKRYTICDWHAVPGEDKYSKWTIPLVCTSYPSGLVFTDGTMMLNQSIFEDMTYTVECNNETAIARFYPTDGYVSLLVEPTQSYFLFGQSGPAKFYFNYTRHLRSLAKDRLTCTVILKPEENIDGFRFIGDTLLFGHSNVSNTLRTNYRVKCADEFLERWTNITVYHPLNLQLVIEGERRSIYFSGIFLSFSCKIQFPNSNVPSSDPHVYWEPGSVHSFTVTEYNITLDTQNMRGVFRPTCIYHYDPHEMNESVYFMIY